MTMANLSSIPCKGSTTPSPLSRMQGLHGALGSGEQRSLCKWGLLGSFLWLFSSRATQTIKAELSPIWNSEGTISPCHWQGINK